MSTNAVTGASSAGTLTQAIAGNKKLGQDEFLKLLVTQMTNQDPLSPEDDKSFIASMAQFSSVESLGSLSSSMGQLQAASLLGKTVEATVTDDTGSRTVTGQVSAVTYSSGVANLQVGADSVKLSEVVQVR